MHTVASSSSPSPDDAAALAAGFPLERVRSRTTHGLLAQALVEAIEAGVVAAGARLPSERDLAAAYGISRSTVRQALGTLERRGRVIRAVGRAGGTFVSERKLARGLSAFRGVTDQFRDQGVELRAEVVSADRCAAPRVAAAALELEPGEAVFELVRIRRDRDRAIALERSCFPAAPFPGLLQHDLSSRIHPLLRSAYGLAPDCARESIEAVPAEADEAGMLEVAEGTSLVYVERVGYTRTGRPLEFSREFFRSDRTRIVVWSPEQPAAADAG